MNNKLINNIAEVPERPTEKELELMTSKLWTHMILIITWCEAIVTQKKLNVVTRPFVFTKKARGRMTRLEKNFCE